MARHREVDVAGELDEAVDEVELARPPREVVRIDRDAVAADAGSRREAHEAERLRRRGVDHLPDVEAHPLAQQRELVDERDVDVAEDVLEELRQLRGVGRGELEDVVVDRAEERSGAARSRPGSSRRRAAGRPSTALAGSPGLTRSGAKARSKSWPARRPDRSSSSRNGPLVVPGNVVDWRTTSWPARRCSRISAAADRTGPRSGSFERRDRRRDADEDDVGVGEAAHAPGSTTLRPPSSAAARRSFEMSSIGERPAASSATRGPLASMPSTSRPASTNAIASGRPT